MSRKPLLQGEDLEKALLKFARKYDSKMLHETINLLVAGLGSGGEIAVLLNKIASNIQENNLVKREISASVTTYVIFIGVATIVAAPVLFALSTNLLIIIKKITSQIVIDNSAGMTSLFSFNFKGDAIKVESFKNFALLALVISSFFSAAITSTIRKGTIKDGIKLIPVFMGVSLAIYLFASYLIGTLMSGLF